jgi:hypothetical protein
MNVYKYSYKSKEVNILVHRVNLVLTRSEPCDATPAELERSRLLRHLAEHKTHKAKFDYTHAVRLRGKPASQRHASSMGTMQTKYTSITTLKTLQQKLSKIRYNPLCKAWTDRGSVV